MVEIPAICLTAVVVGLLAYHYWHTQILTPFEMSGDKWYLRQFAFTDQPISAPYCWRPLLPWLARVFGFKPVSYFCLVATPLLIYYYVGGGWVGFCCGLIWATNPHIFHFVVKNPEYVEGVGHFLLVACLMAMQSSSWAFLPLAFLAALTRETLTATLGVLALLFNPWGLIPLALGATVARLARKEDPNNQHPLIEDTYYGTVARWVREKGSRAFHYAHTVQPLRGLPLVVPFVWSEVGIEARLALVALIPIWLLGLPASGQSRIVCYGLVFFLPFVAALPVEWVWFVTLVSAFWPIDFSTYNEAGAKSFAFTR